MERNAVITESTPVSVGARKAVRSEWLLILAIILVAMDLRPGIVSIGPVLPTIIDAFGLSHTTASLMTSIPDLLMGALALPTPWLVRKFGVNRVLLAALALLGVATIARAFAPNVATLLGTTVGVGAGIAVAGALFGGLIKTKFSSKVALIMGIYATAISLGSALSAGSTGWIAQSLGLGWRTATGVWGVFSIIAIAAWWLVVRSEPKTPAAPPKASNAKMPIRNRTAWLIALYFAGVNFLFYSVLTWTAPMYQEHGLSSTAAGLILAAYTIVFMFASPIAGIVSKSTDRRLWLALSAAITLVGLLGIAIAPNALPFVWVSIVALGLGGAFTLGMTLPLDNTTTADEANRWSAFILTIGYLTAATGPLAMGYLRDVTGHFSLSFAMLVAVAAIMLLVSPFLKPNESK